MLRHILLVSIAALLLAGLWLALKPAPPSAVPPAPAAPHLFAFSIAGGQASGPAVMKVQQGDTVRLRVVSDSADHLHLHGYELAAELQPGTPLTLKFVAAHSGRFELELHHSHASLGNLEVYPRP